MLVEGNRVWLSDFDRWLARTHGDEVHEAVQAAGIEHWGNTDDPETIRHYKHVGHLCERATDHFFGLCAYDPHKPIGACDLGIAEVRGRQIDPRSRFLPELPIRGRMIKGKPASVERHIDKPFILGRLDADEQWMDVVGWLVGWEAMARIERNRYIYHASERCWYVPEPYHSVDSFRHWVAAGAPPHQRPALAR